MEDLLDKLARFTFARNDEDAVFLDKSAAAQAIQAEQIPTFKHQTHRPVFAESRRFATQSQMEVQA